MVNDQFETESSGGGGGTTIGPQNPGGGGSNPNPGAQMINGLIKHLS